MTITATEASPNSTWRLEVDETGAGTEWTPVAGLNSFAANQNYSTADNSDFNSGLYGSDAVTQIKEQIAATVLRRHDGSAYDAGQEAIRKAARAADLLHIRYYDTAFVADAVAGESAEAYEADVYCQWAPQGGGTTGLQSVSITMMVQGEPAEIAHPDAPTV